MIRRVQGRTIVRGQARGTALVSREPLSLYGGLDPTTGLIQEAGHPLHGRSVAGCVLVFPHGRGSTVGSYVLYRLHKAGLAPAALINLECEAIVAVGAILARIPAIDQVPRDFFDRLTDGQLLTVDGDRGTVEWDAETGNQG